MVHIWVRAEQRPFEQRVGLTPNGAKQLINAGFQITIEESSSRAIPINLYEEAGCNIAQEHSWTDAADDTIIFGLKELNEDGPDLKHRHIMFGHAYKGQKDGPHLLKRFKRAGGTLYDLEYLTVEDGRRIAAFGYWAGFAGAAVGLMAWLAQLEKTSLGPVSVYQDKDILVEELARKLDGLEHTGVSHPDAIIIGAKGRVGTGASDLYEALNMKTAKWDMEETAHGGPFPEILDHTIFVNCILARPGVPVFVPESAVEMNRSLRVIADVSCDPNSDYNPIPIYDHSTTFAEPTLRVTDEPYPLDVMAIDNLPSMLPVESSEDYADQLLPHLMTLNNLDEGVWSRAESIFNTHTKDL